MTARTKKTKREQEKEIGTPFAIDEAALDKEWLGQAELYHSYAEKLADARLSLDEAKRELDVTEADLALAIREDPEEYDLTKVTESSIKECLRTQDEYYEARASVDKAYHKMNLLQAAVTALEHRKRALEKLVDLHNSDYFAEPHARTTGGREYVEQTRKESARRRAAGNK